MEEAWRWVGLRKLANPMCMIFINTNCKTTMLLPGNISHHNASSLMFISYRFHPPPPSLAPLPLTALFINFLVGSLHESVHWEGILISCNFCRRDVYGSEVQWAAGEHRCRFFGVTREEWVRNWHLGFPAYFHGVSGSVHIYIWRTHCTRWRIRVQTYYLFFILWLELDGWQYELLLS